MSLFLSLGFLFFLLLLTLLPLIKKQFKQKLNLPPGPPKLPIIGNLHQLGALPHRSVWKLSQKYGPVILLKYGAMPTVVISSSEAARQVLKVYDLQTCTRPALTVFRRLSYNCVDIACCSYGDYWREMRKIVVLKLLISKRVQSFQSIREQSVSSMIGSISQASLSETAVDLSEMLFSLTATATCRIAFGNAFKGSKFDDDRFLDIMHDGMELLAGFSATDFFPPVGWFIDLLTGLHGRIERTFKDFDAFYQEIIDQRVHMKRTEDKQGEDLIDELIRLAENQTNSSDALGITQDHIKAILSNIFIGGVDTSTIVMVWAMTELIRNSRVMRKVQHEIRSCIGKRGMVTEKDIEKLKYLKLVVKETLRMHPPSPFLPPRETMYAVKINGYDVPPKTRVEINVWGIGRDPNIWKYPDEFVPERFEDNPIDYKGQHFEYLPFGSGRRGCPGRNMGLTMVDLVLANLLYSFDWTLPNGSTGDHIDMEECFGLGTYKKKPLVLLPRRHENAFLAE